MAISAISQLLVNSTLPGPWSSEGVALFFEPNSNLEHGQGAKVQPCALT